ncbi:hypothetical protein [Streptomyces sp. NPDC047123]|uniref:hypothetical protein n=1 Tax=Streptomyces sp. NPDC047123 TaxID=3155622 RepID=UPI0033D9E040
MSGGADRLDGRVPTDPGPRGPGAAFTPPLPAAAGASPPDETLRLPGRAPAPAASDLSRV